MAPLTMLSDAFETVTTVVVTPAAVNCCNVKSPLSDCEPTVSVAPGVVPLPGAENSKYGPAGSGVA